MRTRRSVEAILHAEAEQLADLSPAELDAPIAGPNSHPDVSDSGFDPEPTTDVPGPHVRSSPARMLAPTRHFGGASPSGRICAPNAGDSPRGENWRTGSLPNRTRRLRQSGSPTAE